jgi:predicted transcriptional regulator
MGDSGTYSEEIERRLARIAAMLRNLTDDLNGTADELAEYNASPRSWHDPWRRNKPRQRPYDQDTME